MRVLIVIEDTPSGRIATEMSCRGGDDESPAAQIAARVADFIDRERETEQAKEAENDHLLF